MTLQELSSSQSLQDLITSKSVACVTFSAHWCGPCKASKPQLEDMARELSSKVPMAIVYEDTLGNDIHNFNIRAFPTYVLFVQGKEQERVEGVNLAAVRAMVEKGAAQVDPWASAKGGTALGGDGVASAAVSPEEARRLRLAKLGGAGAPPAAESTSSPPAESKPAAAETAEEVTPMETEETTNNNSKDVEMKDAAEETNVCPPASSETDLLASLDKEAITMLTESMGFSLLRAQKGLLYGNAQTVESAVEWLTEHQEDANIDDPIDVSKLPSAGVGAKAQSYKCNECGKILSNMANLELHANKTGHSDFEESTEQVVPLTAEEKAAKIAEIKELLKAKRTEREMAEKSDDKEREKQRRFMGKEMAKTREQLEGEQRKREAQLRKKEKDDFKKERARLRAELAKDKAERQANKGKLATKLGVDGYQPDGIQYDLDGGDDTGDAPKKKPKIDPAKIDEYITKVSSYRAGGDGGKCLKVLKIYVSNVVDHPDEAKFKSINMDNKAFKTKIKPFIGAKQLLMAVGFRPPEGQAETTLQLDEDNLDMAVLQETKAKLEAALVKYG